MELNYKRPEHFACFDQELLAYYPGEGGLKYKVVSRCDQGFAQIHPKQVFSPGAEVHPKWLFHILSHKFHHLTELYNQIKPQDFKKGSLFGETLPILHP